MEHPTDYKKAVNEGGQYYGVHLDEAALDAFVLYYDLLSEWSSRVNLVSKRDMNRFVDYHILDSLKVATIADFSCIESILDFGSGAGLPGIPLAISFPETAVTLLESRPKRCSFLSAACTAIPLPNAHVVQSSIESLDNSFYNRYDVVITRATGSLVDLYRKAGKLLAKNGSLISIKGRNIEHELSELRERFDTTAANLSVVVPEPYRNVRQGKVVILKRL